MNCNKCGAEISDSAKFCMYCGAKLSKGDKDNVLGEMENKQHSRSEASVDIQNDQDALRTNRTSEHLSAEGGIKQRFLSRWKALGPFGKLAVIATLIIAILLTVSICTRKIWPIVFSAIQAIGFVLALLLHNGVIKSGKKWPEYILVIAAILLSAANLNSYSWGKANAEKVNPSKDSVINQEEKKVNSPCEAGACVGEEKSAVNKLFSSVGFTNITTEALNDLELNDAERCGQVEAVTINGLSNFEANQEFSAASKVLIIYHAFKTVPVPVSSDAAKEMDINELVNLFSGAGFIDINTDETVDLDPDITSSDFVNTVFVNGNSLFDENQEFPIDSKIIIKTHWVYEKHTVKLLIDFIPNLIFSKYDVELEFGGETKALTHGNDAEFEYRLKPGKYTLTFTSAESSSVIGSTELEVSGDTEASYKINCTSEKINIDLVYVETPDAVGENEAMIPLSASTCKFKNHTEVKDAFSNAGFTNISELILYDIVWGWTSSGEVDSVTVDGISDFSRGNIFSKDVAVVITYHMPEEDDPSYIQLEENHTDFVGMSYEDVEQSFVNMGFTNIMTEEKPTGDASHRDGEVVSVSIDYKSFNFGDKFKPSDKVLITYYVIEGSEDNPGDKTNSERLSYTTNDTESSKKGNTGVYAYRKTGPVYSIYYIIDFDEGYVYRFVDGEGGDISCDRLKIESGDLNSVVIITYHDGDSIYSNGLHFKWANQPDHLVLEDNDHFESDFYPTDLDAALKIKAAKKIVDY